MLVDAPLSRGLRPLRLMPPPRRLGLPGGRLLFLPADFFDAFELLDWQPMFAHTRYHDSSACFRLDRVGGDQHDHLSPEQRDQDLSQIPPRACISPVPALERPETDPHLLAH
jgi:hypothetical protein